MSTLILILVIWACVVLGGNVLKFIKEALNIGSDRLLSKMRGGKHRRRYDDDDDLED